MDRPAFSLSGNHNGEDIIFCCSKIYKGEGGSSGEENIIKNGAKGQAVDYSRRWIADIAGFLARGGRICSASASCSYSAT
jgi:hypothetical protein